MSSTGYILSIDSAYADTNTKGTTEAIEEGSEKEQFLYQLRAQNPFFKLT